MNEKNEKQALLDELDWCIENGMSGPRSKEALVAARAALAQQPQGEPRSHLRQWSDVIAQLPVSREAAPVAQGLTDEQIRAVSVKYAAFVEAGKYDITKYDCEEDFFNCVRAILAQSAVTAPLQGTQEPSASAHFTMEQMQEYAEGYYNGRVQTERSASGQQAVSDADISAALEFMVDADSAEKMRSVCRQLRPDLVAELVRRRIIDEKYAPAAPAPTQGTQEPSASAQQAEPVVTAIPPEAGYIGWVFTQYPDGRIEVMRPDQQSQCLNIKDLPVRWAALFHEMARALSLPLAAPAPSASPAEQIEDAEPTA